MLVVKIGGNAHVDTAHLLDDLATRTDWVLVHGASDPATRLGERLGHPPRFVTSVSGHVSRFTDEATLEAFTMASTHLNTHLVQELQARGVDAVGLTGASGALLTGPRKPVIKVRTDGGRKRVLRGDHTGRVTEVNTPLLHALHASGHPPVVGLPMLCHDGSLANADADRAAATVAGALGADTLVLLTDVPGLLRDVEDPGSLVEHVGPGGWEEAMTLARGRFRKKLLAAREALEGGVDRVVVATANRDQPLTRALKGGGTVLEPPAPEVMH